MSETTKCRLCGEPMPESESMFAYHGLSGPCPTHPLKAPTTTQLQNDVRNLAKWLNEEQLCDIDRHALARVLAFLSNKK